MGRGWDSAAGARARAERLVIRSRRFMGGILRRGGMGGKENEFAAERPTSQNRNPFGKRRASVWHPGWWLYLFGGALDLGDNFLSWKA